MHGVAFGRLNYLLLNVLVDGTTIEKLRIQDEEWKHHEPFNRTHESCSHIDALRACVENDFNMAIMSIPHTAAPNANAAARPLASAMPPEAIYGTFSSPPARAS